METQEPEQIILRELQSDEHLLWSGRPAQGFRLRSSDVFLIPFSLAWGGFAFFWEFMVIKSGAPLFFALFGLPFMLIGSYLIAGRFFADMVMRKNTAYGLTDKRVITVSGLFSRSTRAIPLPSVGEVTVTEKADRSGTIVFGSGNAMATTVVNASWPKIGRATGITSFEMIENVHDVYQRISSAQQSLVAHRG